MNETTDKLQSFVDILPWDDILVKAILPHLSIQSLFLLRGVNRQCKSLVDHYFQQNNKLDLIAVSEKFNAMAFNVATRHAQKIQVALLRNAKNWLTNDLLRSLIFNSRKLSVLDLTNCSDLSSDVLQALGACCPKLRKLILSDCHWLDLDGVTAVALGCPDLEHVNFCGCWNLEDEAVQTLVMGCSRIVYMSLSRIYNLTDCSLTCIAKHCNSLEHLNIQGCWRVTNDGVKYLAEYCKKLKGLQAKDCRDITEESLSVLRRKNIKVDKPCPPRLRCFQLPLSDRLYVQI